MEVFIKDFWGVLVAFVGLVVWIVRLEARANANQEGLARLEIRLEKQRAEDLTREKERDGETRRMILELQHEVRSLPGILKSLLAK